MGTVAGHRRGQSQQGLAGVTRWFANAPRPHPQVDATAQELRHDISWSGLARGGGLTAIRRCCEYRHKYRSQSRAGAGCAGSSDPKATADQTAARVNKAGPALCLRPLSPLGGQPSPERESDRIGSDRPGGARRRPSAAVRRPPIRRERARCLCAVRWALSAQPRQPRLPGIRAQGSGPAARPAPPRRTPPPPYRVGPPQDALRLRLRDALHSAQCKGRPDDKHLSY